MDRTILNQSSIPGLKAQMDMEVKKLLAQKSVLAWIIRRNVKEFAGMGLPEIVDCIEGTPQVEYIRIDPGKTNSEIVGRSNENGTVGEGYITFDIIFDLFLPCSEGYIKLIVNIEAQKKYDPGYAIVTRAIFYCARMLSAQKTQEFEHSNYDDLKKVYSIWICMNAPESVGNAISQYRICKEDDIAGIPDLPEAYDKLSVVVITLNDKCENEDQFIGMIGTLLSDKIEAEDKIRRLQDEFHMEIDNDLKEGINTMCNLSDIVEERGIIRGRKEGIEEGIKEGIKEGIRTGKEEEKRSVAVKMLETGKYLPEEIASLTELSIEEILKLKVVKGEEK